MHLDAKKKKKLFLQNSPWLGHKYSFTLKKDALETSSHNVAGVATKFLVNSKGGISES